MTRNAWLTPDIAPAGFLCRQLLIPDDPVWLAIVSGCLSELIYRHNFEEYGTATPAETAAVFRIMFDQFSLSGGCGMPPSGSIVMWGNSGPPDGWIMCDGQEVARETFPDLFAAIGTGFGDGDGLFTFNVPNFQCVTPIGVGSRTDYTDRVLNGLVGSESVALNVFEMPEHNHTDIGHQHGYSAANPSVGAEIAGVPVPSATQFGSLTDTGYATLENTGSNQPHNNMQPSLGVYFIIKS